MVRRRPHRAKEALADDPLVPIDCDILRALMDDLALTVADLATHTGDSHQTISHLYKGTGMGRCRATRRRALATALGVPEEMLAKGRVFIPHMPAMPDGYEMLYSQGTRLAASRLLTKATNACERDLDDPALSPPEYSRIASREIIVNYVGWYVSELIQIGEWRKRLIDWDPTELELRGYTEPATSDPWTDRQRPADDPAHEGAVLGFTRSVEHTLSPWFEGKARLNYRSLRDLVHLPKHPFAGTVEKIPTTSPYAVLLASTVKNVKPALVGPAKKRTPKKKPASKAKRAEKRRS